jgi:hypothetical protein
MKSSPMAPYTPEDFVSEPLWYWGHLEREQRIACGGCVELYV